LQGLPPPSEHRSIFSFSRHHNPSSRSRHYRLEANPHRLLLPALPATCAAKSRKAPSLRSHEPARPSARPQHRALVAQDLSRRRSVSIVAPCAHATENLAPPIHHHLQEVLHSLPPARSRDSIHPHSDPRQ
jgi:hypothetical protein